MNRLVELSLLVKSKRFFQKVLRGLLRLAEDGATDRAAKTRRYIKLRVGLFYHTDNEKRGSIGLPRLVDWN